MKNALFIAGSELLQSGSCRFGQFRAEQHDLQNMNTVCALQYGL